MGKSIPYIRSAVGVGLALAIGLLASNFVVSAGPLEPPAAPASSSITLNQLGEKMDGVAEKLTDTPGYIPPARGTGLISAQDGVELTSILLTLTGVTQGEIIGGVTAEGYEGSIAVLGFSHKVVSPRDAASGLPTGKRQHTPLTIIKAIDRSSPLLYAMLVNNENIPTLHLRFYRAKIDGGREHYYSIKLFNASISSMETEYPSTESISFCYQKINWTFEDGGIESQDDWEAPEV